MKCSNKARVRSFPTVLVMGDSEGATVHALTTAAWNKIREQYPRQSRDILDAVWKSASEAPRHIQPAPQDMLLCIGTLRNREIGMPMPLPLLDDGQQPPSWWREHLFRYLTTFNVWALIAVGRAARTQRLLTALRPLQVPTIVTLSSVGHLSGSGDTDDVIHAGHILSLFPSNDTQAQVIAAQVHYLLAASGSKRQVYIFKETATDLYVTDLAKALATHLNLQHVLTTDALTARDVEANAVVICVGYSAVLEQLRESRNRYKHIIATDGIELAATRRSATAERGVATYYQVSPVLPPAVHAEQAYCAVREVLRAEFFTPQVDRELVLDQFIERVRRRLERAYDYYQFAGNRNTRATYTIEVVDPEEIA
jgi:hypothetical protein